MTEILFYHLTESRLEDALPPLLERIPYRRLQRPLFPLDRSFAWTPKARVFG